MLLLALPLLLMPDLLIHAWIQQARLPRQLCGHVGARRRASDPPADLRPHAVPDRASAAARRRLISIATTVANLVLSFILASTWGIRGVALSTLVTDALALAYILPRYAAPAAGTSALALVRAICGRHCRRWSLRRDPGRTRARLAPGHAARHGSARPALDRRRRRPDLAVRPGRRRTSRSGSSYGAPAGSRRHLERDTGRAPRLRSARAARPSRARAPPGRAAAASSARAASSVSR